MTLREYGKPEYNLQSAKKDAVDCGFTIRGIAETEHKIILVVTINHES